jgi:hypothetical protein
MSFPANPVNNQQVTVNGVVYTYSTTLGAWTVTTSSGAALSANSIATTGTGAIGSTLTVTGTSVLASATFSGTASAVGNVTGGNLVTAGLISAAGNVSGGNLNVTGNIVDTGALSIITGSNGNIALTPNGTGIVTSSSAINATGNISATGNITGSFLFGNGSLLTGLSTSSISNGTSSVAVIASGGNIRDNVGGATIATTSSTGVGVTGNVTATSYLGSQFVQSTRNISANTTIGNINVMSAGPITINDGVVVTVSTGGEWTVV